MLNDHDRETLDEIEHRLAAEDPLFTSSFDLKARRLGTGGADHHQTLIVASIVVAILLSAFMIVVHAAGPALFFTAVTCCLIWMRRVRRPRKPHQDS
ncbi:MAG: DUF3040 domain-containing protein [Pseudonocardia sp.]|nr:DUF3040 domain-containing protein [Pseudonocardia sp.]